MRIESQSLSSRGQICSKDLDKIIKEPQWQQSQSRIIPHPLIIKELSSRSLMAKRKKLEYSVLALYLTRSRQRH